MKIIKRTNWWFGISGALMLAALLLWIALGLNLGIDFTGGSLLEVRYDNVERPAQAEVLEAVKDLNIPITVSAAGEQGYILRFAEVDEETHQRIIGQLEAIVADAEVAEGAAAPAVTELQFNSIGPVVGQELAERSVNAIIVVLLAIIAYIAYAFRKVSYPVQSWKYGVVAIITLFHDILITIGVFILLGKVFGWQVDATFVAALLTILGYSVNDTIVIFDRIRENLHRLDGTFEDIVEASVNETVPRSLNMTITTVLALGAILFFGGVTIQPFVGALIVGMLIGTYSSIFVASPLLVLWQRIEWKLKKS